MEEFIYILIGVIWLAATIYRASQKKKQQQAKQARPPESTTREKPESPTVSSLLEELLEGQRLRIPEPEVSEIEYDEPMVEEVSEREPTPSFQSEYANYQGSRLEALKGEGESAFNRIVFDDIMKIREEKPRRNVKFDLRKAVIYSAILERPYT
jgi:FtsZ-interacting cell division protein ZipA